MPGQGICEVCPVKAYCEAGRELAELHNTDTNKKTIALGAVSMTGLALEAVTQRIDCPGSQVNQNGQLVCPLESIALASRNAAMTNWQNLSFDVTKINTNETAPSHTTGQYL